jgi:hypothetical protein
MKSTAIADYSSGMAIKRANRSDRFQESLWLRTGNDPLERILQRLGAFDGSALCPFRLPGTETGAGADVSFELTLLPTLVKRERSIAFSWRHHWGTPLPSLVGTITASRFGPFVNVLVAAEYSYTDDVAGRLVHEAIGEQCATTSARCLLELLRSLFSPAHVRARRVS